MLVFLNKFERLQSQYSTQISTEVYSSQDTQFSSQVQELTMMQELQKFMLDTNCGGGLLQAGVSDAIEAGAMADLGAAKVGLHVYDEASGRNIYVLCVKSDLGVAKVGLEIDYTTLDTAPAGADDSAYGVALNLDPAVSNTVSVPIRIEYIDNKNSGIYLTGKDNAMSLTVTPTYKPTGNTFVRAEIAYTSTDAKVFVDDSGSAKDNRTYLGFEAGFLF